MKKIVISGGSSGIGKSLVETFAGAGPEAATAGGAAKATVGARLCARRTPTSVMKDATRAPIVAEIAHGCIRTSSSTRSFCRA